MIIYILALFSLVFVFPIFFLLPVNFSKKGRLLIISSAFFISVIGLFAQYIDIFIWWQTVLLMLLLVIIFTYFLMKKSPELLFRANEGEFEDEFFGGDFLDETAVLKEADNRKENQEAASLESYALTEDFPLQKEEHISSRPINADLEEDLLENVILDREQLDERMQEELLSAEWDRDINNNEEQKAAFMEDANDIINVGQHEINYMDEIEKMLEDRDASRLDDLSQENGNFLLPTDASKAGFEEIKENESAIDELEILVFQEGNDDFSADAVPETLQFELEELPLQAKTLDKEELADSIATKETLQTADKKNGQSIPLLAHQVVNNTFEQLKLMKSITSKEEYEDMLIKCMSDLIPLYDYFAFSILLIEQYVHFCEYEKLESLFEFLKLKFQHEPILLEQLIFMEQNYLLN